MPTLEEKATSPMQKKVDELNQRQARIKLGGGADRIDKQHKAGKMSARERIDALVDADSFEESGLFAQHRCTMFGMEGKELPADGVVTGAGSVAGRLIARTLRLREEPPARCTPPRSPRP